MCLLTIPFEFFEGVKDHVDRVILDIEYEDKKKCHNSLLKLTIETKISWDENYQESKE